jgi:hypothetical protein
LFVCNRYLLRTNYKKHIIAPKALEIRQHLIKRLVQDEKFLFRGLNGVTTILSQEEVRPVGCALLLICIWHVAVYGMGVLYIVDRHCDVVRIFADFPTVIYLFILVGIAPSPGWYP